MPRKYVPKTKKTNRRPRYRRARPRKMLSMYKAPIPNKIAAKLRYSDATTIDPGVLGLGVHVIMANGCYDPDNTGAGHQPRGFDQYMAMYDHYTVVGSKITVTFLHTREGILDATLVGIACRDGTGTATSINSYAEGRNVVSRVLPGHDASSSPIQPITLSKTCSTRKFLGRSKVMSDPELKGNASNNPAEDICYHIFCGTPWLIGDPGQAININFVIDYLVVFHEPKQPAQS